LGPFSLIETNATQISLSDPDRASMAVYKIGFLLNYVWHGCTTTPRIQLTVRRVANLNLEYSPPTDFQTKAGLGNSNALESGKVHGGPNLTQVRAH
jgi:hypothetical protein